MTTAQDLADGKYVLLTTFRKSGAPVATALWVVPDGDGAAAWTSGDSGKVKRLRHQPRATLAPCTLRGVPTGPAIEVSVEIQGGEVAADVRRRIARKYRLLGPVITGWENRGRDERVALLIRDA